MMMTGRNADAWVGIFLFCPSSDARLSWVNGDSANHNHIFSRLCEKQCLIAIILKFFGLKQVTLV